MSSVSPRIACQEGYHDSTGSSLTAQNESILHLVRQLDHTMNKNADLIRRVRSEQQRQAQQPIITSPTTPASPSMDSGASQKQVLFHTLANQKNCIDQATPPIQISKLQAENAALVKERDLLQSQLKKLKASSTKKNQSSDPKSVDALTAEIASLSIRLASVRRSHRALEWISHSIRGKFLSLCLYVVRE